MVLRSANSLLIVFRSGLQDSKPGRAFDSIFRISTKSCGKASMTSKPPGIPEPQLGMISGISSDSLPHDDSIAPISGSRIPGFGHKTVLRVPGKINDGKVGWMTHECPRKVEAASCRLRTPIAAIEGDPPVTGSCISVDARKAAGRRFYNRKFSSLLCPPRKKQGRQSQLESQIASNAGTWDPRAPARGGGRESNISFRAIRQKKTPRAGARGSQGIRTSLVCRPGKKRHGMPKHSAPSGFRIESISAFHSPPAASAFFASVVSVFFALASSSVSTGRLMGLRGKLPSILAAFQIMAAMTVEACFRSSA